MLYGEHYYSPVGKILLCADDEGLTMLIFHGDKYNGDLSGGIDKKIKLLTLEKIPLDERGVVNAK